MRIPNADIARQIALISPGLYPRWSPKRNKWLIVRDFSRRVPGITEYDPIAGRNYVVELVVEDEHRQGIELDQRVLNVIQMTLKEKDRFYGPDGFSVDKFCNAMDDEERLKVARARQFRHAASTEFFKHLWALMKQRTWNLNPEKDRAWVR